MDFIKLIEQKINEKIDIIFLDPPYDSNYVFLAIDKLIKNKRLNKDSLIIIETDQKERIKEKINNLPVDIIDERKYGRANLIFLKKRD